jgi:hypothetical protein
VGEGSPSERATASLLSLEREFLRVLASPDGIKIGRSIYRSRMGDGWSDPRTSAVLAEAVARWLDPNNVQLVGFYLDGDEPCDVVAAVGQVFVSRAGFCSQDEAFSRCCEAHGSDPASSFFGEFMPFSAGRYVAWADEFSEQAIVRLADLLSDSVDSDVARMVLGI